MECIPAQEYLPPTPGGLFGLYSPTSNGQNRPIQIVLQHQEPSPTNRRLKRPHTKSRRGCLNCKSRRVKCQETWPACANCTTRDLDCKYADEAAGQLTRNELARRRVDTPDALLSPPLSRQPSGAQFTGEDLRFFHHFLLVARPHLPFGNEGAWSTQVPAYAHECPQLMHAILSLGATHYSLVAPSASRYTPMAIAHRGKALQLLGAALSKGDNCLDTEMDGILATCYALVFQAYYMSDGLVDFAVMVRGCAIVTNRIRTRYTKSQMFILQSQEEVSALVGSWLPTESVPLQKAPASFIEDLEKLRPLLQSRAHHAFFDAIHATYVGLQHSPHQAFFGLTELYAVWYNMESLEFLTFIDPGNHISSALFIHYIAVEILMRPVLLYTGGGRDMTQPFSTVAVHQWANAIYHKLPMPMCRLVKGQAEFIASDKETSESSSREQSQQGLL